MKKTKAKEATIYVHCSPKLKARVEAEAARDQRSMRWAVERALTAWCDAQAEARLVAESHES